MYTVKHMTLLGEIKEVLDKWRCILFMDRSPNIVNMSILLRLMETFNGIQIKIPAGFFGFLGGFLVELDKLTLISIWKWKVPRKVETNFEKEE